MGVKGTRERGWQGRRDGGEEITWEGGGEGGGEVSGWDREGRCQRRGSLATSPTIELLKDRTHKIAEPIEEEEGGGERSMGQRESRRVR